MSARFRHKVSVDITAERLAGARLWLSLIALSFVLGASAIEASKDQALFLQGRLLYEEDQYAEAQVLFEQAVAINPIDSEYHRWLGKSYGRKAEGSGWLTALKYATKARKSFETAVALDDHNAMAMRDLLEFYVAAPGIIGGGMDKARPLAERLLALDPSFSEEVQELLGEGE